MADCAESNTIRSGRPLLRQWVAQPGSGGENTGARRPWIDYAIESCYTSVMKLSDLIHSPQPTMRPSQVAALVVAGVFFVLTITAGYLGLKTTTVILGGLTGGLISLVISFTYLWRAKWVWRFIEWGHPRTEESRRRQIITCYILAILTALMLVISLL